MTRQDSDSGKIFRMGWFVMSSVRETKVPNGCHSIPLITIRERKKPKIASAFGYFRTIGSIFRSYIGKDGKCRAILVWLPLASRSHASGMGRYFGNITFAAPLARHPRRGMFIVFAVVCCCAVVFGECKVRKASAASIPIIMTNKDQPILVQNKSTDFTVEKVAGPPGTRLPVRVVVGSALLSSKEGVDPPFVNFAGLPDSCRLSAGIKRTRSWSVPIDKLAGLMLLPGAGCEGDFQVLVMIYDGNDVLTDSMRTVSFSIHPDPGKPPPPVRVAPVRVAPIEAKPAADAVPPALEEALLKKGENFLKNGDISAARLSFESLASRGSAKGASALAKSFDPAILNSMAIAGLKPDLEKAKEWYAKAAELGDGDAAQRLSALKSIRLDTAAGDQTPTQ